MVKYDLAALCFQYRSKIPDLLIGEKPEFNLLFSQKGILINLCDHAGNPDGYRSLVIQLIMTDSQQAAASADQSSLIENPVIPKTVFLLLY